MTAAARPLSSPPPSGSAKLEGWTAISAVLQVPPETAMRWRLEHRDFPIQEERRENARRTVKRITADRAELVAWLEQHREDLAPPRRPRLLANKLRRKAEFPELALYQEPGIVNEIGPQVPRRYRWKNMIGSAPLLTITQKGRALMFDRHAEQLDNGAWGVTRLAVSVLAHRWGCDERTVQRSADELAPALATYDKLFLRENGLTSSQRRTRADLCNIYLEVISCEVLQVLGYTLTPDLCRAIADLDPTAEARARDLEARSGSRRQRPARPSPPRAPADSPPPPPARPGAPAGTPKPPPAPPATMPPPPSREPKRQAARTESVEVMEIQIALERIPNLDGCLEPDDAAKLAGLGAKGARCERPGLNERLVAIWTAADASDLVGRALLNGAGRDHPGIRNFVRRIGEFPAVSDEEVIQRFVRRTPLVPLDDPKLQTPFAKRIVEIAREAKRPLYGPGGVLDILRGLERDLPDGSLKDQRAYVVAAIRGVATVVVDGILEDEGPPAGAPLPAAPCAPALPPPAAADALPLAPIVGPDQLVAFLVGEPGATMERICQRWLAAPRELLDVLAGVIDAGRVRVDEESRHFVATTGRPGSRPTPRAPP